MRFLMIPAVALAMSVSPAVLAQAQKSGQQGSAQKAQQGGQQASAKSQQQVQDTLKQAGFQDVRILDAAYIVNAKTKDGEQVTMFIDPPMTAGSSGQGGQSGSQSGTSGQQAASGSQQGGSGQAGAAQQGSQQVSLMSRQQLRDSLTQAGFQNIQIVDATYLAEAKTKNGDDVVMMIDPAMASGSTGSGGGGQAGSGASSQQQGGNQ
jgi:uncharacterized protein Smg (DUF494 family)